jgi:hypothetical protein
MILIKQDLHPIVIPDIFSAIPGITPIVYKMQLNNPI